MSASVEKGAFRLLHEAPGAFLMPNAWDIGTAKFLQSLGFQALATTSAGFAFSRGLADGAVPFEAMIAHAKEMAGSVAIPVSADLEKGKGDSPDSAAETIFAADAAGLAGCSIEDHTGDPTDPIYPFEAAVARVRMAADAARALDRDFVFTARAENFLWGRADLDDTIRRLQAFAEAGADVLFAPGLPDLETVRAVCAAVPKPVSVLTSADFTQSQLGEAGVSRISLGSGLAALAFGALDRAAREMLDHGSFTFRRDAMPFARLQTLFAVPE